MRIAFIGAVEFSRRTLELLIEMKQDVVGVCKLKDSLFNADHCDLSDTCRSHRIPWAYTPNINSEESISWLEDKNPDVIFCFGWSKLLGQKVLNLAPRGVVGFHPAALPANRGRDPLICALFWGLKKTASTFFFMDAGADSDDILSQQEISITDQDDARTFYDKVIETALIQIAEFLPQLTTGLFQRINQNNQLANTWRKRSSTDGKIDWRMSAQSIHNLVRGLTTPYVGAHFLVDGK